MDHSVEVYVCPKDLSRSMHDAMTKARLQLSFRTTVNFSTFRHDVTTAFEAHFENFVLAHRAHYDLYFDDYFDAGATTTSVQYHIFFSGLEELIRIDPVELYDFLAENAATAETPIASPLFFTAVRDRRLLPDHMAQYGFDQGLWKRACERREEKNLLNLHTQGNTAMIEKAVASLMKELPAGTRMRTR